MPSIFVSGQGARLAVAGTTAPGYGSAAIGVGTAFDQVRLGTPSGFGDSNSLVHNSNVSTSGTGRSALGTFNLATIAKGKGATIADPMLGDGLNTMTSGNQLLYGQYDIHGIPVTTPVASGVNYYVPNVTGTLRADGQRTVDQAAEPGSQYIASYFTRVGSSTKTNTRSLRT